jgi:hypothetical protein
MSWWNEKCSVCVAAVSLLCVTAHWARFLGRSERSERSIFLWQAYLIAAFAAFAAA